jgi:hypothetical protein
MVFVANNQASEVLKPGKQRFDLPSALLAEHQLKNLKSLSKVLDEMKQNQRIFKAEIARELGEFAECLLLLSYQFDTGYDNAVGFIKKLGEKKRRSFKPFELAP